jgi:hypothetical protein
MADLFGRGASSFDMTGHMGIILRVLLETPEIPGDQTTEWIGPI